jgi:hypothetical protein
MARKKDIFCNSDRGGEKKKISEAYDVWGTRGWWRY